MNKSLFGDANKQIDEVCQQLRNITELLHGFDSIGFSQGGFYERFDRKMPLRSEQFNNFWFSAFGSTGTTSMQRPF